MTVESPRRRPPVADLVQYGILAFVVGSALAGAFTHMHDWTIREINEALTAAGIAHRTPDWFGWANAVISELLPTSAFLSIRQRQRQGRSVVLPTWIFVGSFAVSLLAQLSATGLDVPYAAEFLACLPALAVMILAKVIFADIEHARIEREAAERAAAEAAELARREAAERAELRRSEVARKAELAAELADRREREAAELKARLAREEREHAAELDRRRVEIEQAAVTRREELAAAERQAERDAREREAARRSAAEEAARVEAARVKAAAEAEAVRIAAEADAERVRAEASRVEAEAVARRLAAERVAAARHADRGRGETPGAADAGEAATRRRRPRQETEALVVDVLATLDEGTERPAAVAAVVASLDVTPEYARQFVPAGYVKVASSVTESQDAAASSGRRGHLAVVASG